MFSRYLDLIRQQQINFPKYPKYHYGDKVRLTTDPIRHINDFLTSNSRYVNTIEVSEPIFSSLDDLVYLEYVHINKNPQGTLSDWPYFYIPKSFLDTNFNSIPLRQHLNLTKIYEYNYFKYTGIKSIDPEDVFLSRYSRPINFFFQESLINNLHPICSNFIFTGVFYLLNDTMVYEYIDYNQFHDFNEILYASKLPPVDFYISSTLTRLDSDDLYLDSFIGYPPSSYRWVGDYPRFEYTGNSTSEYFSKNVKWYEYNYFPPNSIGSTSILLPHTPIDRPLDYIYVELGQGNSGINLPTNFNIQQLEYNQTSSNNKIVIGTP